MIDWIGLFLALAAGLLLGAMFFGGLWWTVRRAVSSGCPALWFAGSLLLRLGLALQSSANVMVCSPAIQCWGYCVKTSVNQ